MGCGTHIDLENELRPANERDINYSNPDMLDMLERELMRSMGGGKGGANPL